MGSLGSVSIFTTKMGSLGSVSIFTTKMGSLGPLVSLPLKWVVWVC
jgi:hypothetical protein